MTMHVQLGSVSIVGALRIPFLLLTPVCISLGLAAAYCSGADIKISYLLLVLLGGICAHVSVNTFNEYFDFKSGLDLLTERRPFSGGSGTLPKKPELAFAVLLIAWFSLAITALIGIYFVLALGWGLLPLGGTGLAIVFFYTTFITRHPILCLLAPGLCFGPIMVMGTSFVFMGSYSWMAFAVSLVPFFLVNNLLLLNQFPDIDADRQVGRRHFPLMRGTGFSSLVFAIFMVLAFVVLIGGVLFSILPVGSLLGLVSLVIALPTVVGVLRYAENTEKLLRWMKFNVVLNIVMPTLIAVGMFVGHYEFT